jgi:hypothetical protein
MRLSFSCRSIVLLGQSTHELAIGGEHKSKRKPKWSPCGIRGIMRSGSVYNVLKDGSVAPTATALSDLYEHQTYTDVSGI